VPSESVRYEIGSPRSMVAHGTSRLRVSTTLNTSPRR
jgi:hypothetical protein